MWWLLLAQLLWLDSRSNLVLHLLRFICAIDSAKQQRRRANSASPVNLDLKQSQGAGKTLGRPGGQSERFVCKLRASHTRAASWAGAFAAVCAGRKRVVPQFTVQVGCRWFAGQPAGGIEGESEFVWDARDSSINVHYRGHKAK